MARASGERGRQMSKIKYLTKVLRRSVSFPKHIRSRGSQRHDVASESVGEEMDYNETSDQQVGSGSPTIPTRSSGCEIEHVEATPSASSPVKLEFLDLFLGLPGELQLGILCELGPCDIFSLRATCRAFHEVILIQASPIVRHLVKSSILAKHLGDYIGMYPLPEPTSQLNLDYLFALSHRLHTVDKLSRHIAKFIMTKIFPNFTAAFERLKQIHINRIVCGLRPMLLVLMHFFESYRAALVRYADKRTIRSTYDTPGFIPCCAHEESDIIRKYNGPAQLLPAHNTYRLLNMFFRRKLRLPSYAGRLESTLRGWGKAPATKESIVQLIVLGGFKEVNNVLDSRSYGARLDTLQKYLSRTLPSAEQMPAKRQRFPRLAREGLSRLRGETRPVNGSVYPRVVPIVRDSRVSNPSVALYKISCSVMPGLDTRTAFEVSRFLPDLDSMWFTAAEQRMIEQGVIQSKEDLPRLFYILVPFIMEDSDPVIIENADG